MPSQSSKPVHRITKDDLIFLLDKNDFRILDEVNRREFGFITFLEKCRYSEQKDEAQILEIVMRILRRVCSLRGQKTLARVQRFFRMLRDCDKFLFDDVPRVINSNLTKQKGIDIVSFMINYMSILATLMRKDFFPCSRIVNEIFPELENYMNRMREMRLKNVVEAEKCICSLRREVDSYENASSSDDDENEIRHFRDLSIVPRSNDIVNCEISKIPQNIIDGAYKSVDHYLSVHFRLIREDMLRSFRECIKSCISPGDRWVGDQTKSQLYENVTVKFPEEYNDNGIFYDITLRSSKVVDWSDRREKGLLKPGSLVFLTPNRFQSVVFATTVNNPKAKFSKSKECEIRIKLEDDTFTDKLQDIKYEMIEPAAYFECYKHVLSGIKDFSESSFPLGDIIVYLDCKDPESRNDTFHPEYLEGRQYCLHEKCDGTATDSCSCKDFDPLQEGEWPTADELELDEQQFVAFKTAITKKVAVIQGPPGTGKTYVGGKVVEALLKNCPSKPIVICCLTNHALDQFLELLLKFSTKKIVRLGSQSKSEILEAHKLENMIYAVREIRIGNTLTGILKESSNLVKSIAEQVLEVQDRTVVEDEEVSSIKALSKKINFNLKSHFRCKDNYLDDDALNDIIPSSYKDQLRHLAGSIRKSLSAGVLEWLLCSRVSDLYMKCLKNFENFHREQLEFTKNSKVSNIWGLTETQRFKLFYILRKKCLEVQKKGLDQDIEFYKALMRRNRTKRVNAEKLEILKGADIIGVTTTGACKFKDLIRFSNPAIIIVEEAAQVLEAHIIASLVPSIQHIILIGDHEQLRPLPANQELSEKYNLKISMFERLFRNDAPSATLVSQHRMKPCIAELLVPVPYETYISHKNVYEYKEIRGVISSVFFFDHRESEDKNSSGTSSSNDFEARMIVSFAKYLLLQTYSTKDITILATYGAQVVLILKYMEEPLNGIRVTTVDNFQGEENNIILISFVRSNPSVIGFLKESNRVCVALSRAKMGMFCFGNFQHFAAKSELWSDIVEKLHTKDMISNTLLLKCERHQVPYPATTEKDILRFIDSGCSQKCDFLLPCQHKCIRKCHFHDPDHLQYFCKQPCERMIDENRVCPRLCYEKCKRLKKKQIQLPCGHMSWGNNLMCNEETPRLLPCRHLVTIPCHLDIAHFKCKAAMQIKLNCGHTKTIYCHEQHEKLNVICVEPRPEIGPCGHTVYVPCSLNLHETELIAFCDNACGALLQCGHPCVSYCRLCFDIGIHGYCTEKCDLKLPCGHKCKGFCNSPCPPCTEKCFLTCAHGERTCINACLRSCVKCEKPCKRGCEHNRCSRLCYEECDIGPCMKPCLEKLTCGHRCIGLCGDDCPNLCRICQADDLKASFENNSFVQLECDHVVEVNELTDHIENCLISLDWPHCPLCHSKITFSLRYKNLLMQAKTQCIASNDTSGDVAEIRYLVECMYGEDFIVPARFLPIHKHIMQILRENSGSDTLLVLKNCVMLMKKLVIIAPKLENFYGNERIQSRFETLLLWLDEHLTNASYQQLQELEMSLSQLMKDAS